MDFWSKEAADARHEARRQQEARDRAAAKAKQREDEAKFKAEQVRLSKAR